MKVRMQVANFDWDSSVNTLDEFNKLKRNQEHTVAIYDIELFGGETLLLDIGIVHPLFESVSLLDYSIGDHATTFPIMTFPRTCISRTSRIAETLHLKTVLNPVDFNWRPITFVHTDATSTDVRKLYMFVYQRRALAKSLHFCSAFDSPASVIAHMQSFHARFTSRNYSDSFPVDSLTPFIKEPLNQQGIIYQPAYHMRAISHLAIAAMRPTCLLEMESISIATPGDLLNAIIYNLHEYIKSQEDKEILLTFLRTHADYLPGEHQPSQTVQYILAYSATEDSPFLDICRRYTFAEGSENSEFNMLYYCALHALVFLHVEASCGLFFRSVGAVNHPYLRIL